MSGNYSRQVSLLSRVAYSEIGQLAKLWVPFPFMEMFSHRVDNPFSITVVTDGNVQMLKAPGRWWVSEVGWWEVVGAVEKWRGNGSSKGVVEMQLQVGLIEKQTNCRPNKLCVCVQMVLRPPVYNLASNIIERSPALCRRLSQGTSEFSLEFKAWSISVYHISYLFERMPLLIVALKRFFKKLAMYEVRSQLTSLF